MQNPLPSPQALPEFWEGTPPSLIETYFPKLLVTLTSPVLRGLRAKLEKEKYTEPLQPMTHEKVLLTLLMAEGEWDQAKELLMETHLPDKDAISLNLQWLSGDSKKACEKVTNLIRTSPQNEWKQQNVYCLYLSGEKERAKIAAEILSESDASSAQFLNTLFDPSVKPPFDESIASSPFLLSVWIENQQEIPERALKKLSPASLALLARSKKTPLPTRVLAAERAVQLGTFRSNEFLDLLREEPPTGFWGKVLQALKSPKTETLLPLFEQADQDHKLGLVGQVFGSALSSLDPSEETLPLAPFMIRLLLQSDHKDLANKWGKFYRREAPDEAVAVAPLLHFAFPENKWDDTQLSAWQTYQNRVNSQNAPQRSYELRRILEALNEPSGQPMKGEPSPPSWRRAGALADSQALNLLESAAASQRKGEVLLLTLTMMGDTPLHELSVDKLTPLLKALDKVGYRQEARLLALEFLLGKSLN